MCRKTVLSLIMIAVMAVCAVHFPAAANAQVSNDYFYDDFSGNSLDTSKWLVAQKAWGGQNGGVIPENVSVGDGILTLTGHGDLYTGSQKGVSKSGSYIDQTTRVGGAIATRDYFASGSYEVKAKVAPELGACSAIWTFEYEEYYKGEAGYKGTGSYYAVNHEIDIEMPGRPASSHRDQSFNYALCNTWEGERGGEYTTNYTDLGYPQNDGKFHTYRFDWHTGDVNQEKRVEFYFDGKLVYTATKNIPTNEGRLWIGLWFPNGWAGTPDFDTTQFEIDYVKITPYHEAGDTPQHETYASTGWATGTVYESQNISSDNILVNGSFDDGASGWKLSGDAKIQNGAAVLSSGSKTDTISQTVEVEPGVSYKLIADTLSSGADLVIEVEDYNGRYTSLKKTVNNKQQVELSFTTAAHIKQISIKATVVRYQTNKNDCYVYQMYLTNDLNLNLDVENNKPTEPETEAKTEAPTEAETEAPTEAETEAPTEAETEAPTEAETEAPTEAETEAPTIAEPENALNLLVNGDFKAGLTGWTKSGSAVFETGRVILASGRDTDRIKQIVNIEGGKTYRLTADVTSSGAVIEVGADDYNGKYTSINKTMTSDGKIDITFTVASHMKQISIYAEVLRYQDNSDDCTITNVSLVEVK